MRIRVLGAVEVRAEDGAVLDVTAAKTRWLLAFLALEPQRVRSVDAIVAALWSDEPPKSASNLVQGYVGDLRKLMGARAIRTTVGGYQLEVPSNDVDVARFRDLLGRAEQLVESQPLDALELLDECTRLWRGEPFGEAPPDGALAAAADMLRMRRLDADELRARCMLQTGQHHGLVPELQQLVEAHPYREGLWATLAVALYRSSRQAEALRTLHTARTILEEDLGLSPGHELRDIEQMILRQDPGLEAGDAEPVAVSPHTPVGRHDELARLSDRLRQAGASAQHTVFIGGEPGIGKTTLSRVFARHASEQGVPVLMGRCDEHVAVPYRPFIEALTDHLMALPPADRAATIAPRAATVRAMLPLLDHGLGPATTSSAPTELTLLERFDTFCWLLQQVQGDRPLVVVLDDVHWADSATLRLLHYLTMGNRLPGSVMLATYRTTERAELLDDILADLRTSPLAERMMLHGLEVADLELLMDDGNDRADLAEWIHGQTDGNPFLATEIMRHITETGSRTGVPDGVAEVVGQRLRRLSPPAGRLLRYASILGDCAPVTLLRHIADEPDELSAALAELSQRGILGEDESTPGNYSFRHAIFRGVATSLMTSIEREDLHLAAASAWSKLPASAESNLAVASHYLAAGDIAPTDDAVDAYSQTGKDADRAGAKVEAARWFGHALRLVDVEDPRYRQIRLTRFVAAQAAWHWLHGDHLTSDADDERTGDEQGRRATTPAARGGPASSSGGEGGI